MAGFLSVGGGGGGVVGGATVKLLLDSAAFDAGLAKSQGKLATVGKTMSSVGGAMIKGISLPLAVIGGAAVKMALDFDNAFTKIDANSNASAESIQKWRGEVLRLAGETAQAPQELADALYFLASAGLKAGQEMEVLEMAAKASAAGMGETADIARVTSQAMVAYADSGLTAVQVTDALTVAIKEGTAEPAEFAEALGRILPIASAAGVEFDEVTASLASLSTIGLDVNEGVTAMRGLLGALVAPGTQAAETLESLGISAEEMRRVLSEDGLLAALNMLEEASGGNLDVIQDVIPNIRSLTGFLGITGQEAEKVAATFDNVKNSTGALGEAFATVSESPGFKLQQALTNMKVALIGLGDIILPVVASLIGGLGDLAAAFGSLGEGTKKAIVQAAAFAAGAGIVLKLGGIMIGVVLKVASAYRALELALAGVGVGMSVFLTAAGAVALITAAFLDAQAQAAKWAALTDTLTAKLLAGETTWLRFSSAIRGAADAIDAPEWAQLQFIEGATKAWTDATSAASVAVMDELAAARQIPGAITPAIATMVQAALETGNFERATELIAGAVERAKSAVASSTTVFHAQRDAMLTAAAAAREQAGAAEGVIRAEQGLTGPTAAAAQAAKDHAASLDAEALAAQNVADALRATRAAQLELAGGFLAVQGASLSLEDAQFGLITAQQNVNKMMWAGKAGTLEHKQAVNDLRQAELGVVGASMSLATAILEYDTQMNGSIPTHQEAVALVREFAASAGLSKNATNALVFAVSKLTTAEYGVKDATDAATGSTKANTGAVKDQSAAASTGSARNKQLGADFLSTGSKAITAKGQVDTYAGGIRDVPTKWLSTFTASVGGAISSIGSLNRSINSIDTYKVVTIAVQTVGGYSGTGLSQYAKGGIIGAADGLITRGLSIRPSGVMVGEGTGQTRWGRGTEAVVPLNSRGIGILSEAMTMALSKAMPRMTSGGGGHGHDIVVDGRVMARTVSENLAHASMRSG